MKKKKLRWGMIFVYLFIGIFGIITVFPFIYMILGGLMSYQETTTIPPTLIPKTLRWSNYQKVFEQAPFARYFLNTFITAATTTIVTLFTSILGAFAMTNLKFKIVRIVVVDAVGEPHLLEVLFERLPLLGRAVAGVVLVEGLQRAAHGKVRGAVLVEEDVAAALGGLGEVVDQLLLFERQSVESGHFVADHLHVVEAVDDPRFLARRGVARGERDEGK